MPETYDLVIRNGMVVDGTGANPFKADVAVRDGLIAEIGKVDEQGIEEVDATGCIVTPGFIDVHTHYDGHATWTDRMLPSSNHGVTTVVMGNCGVGFAPCRGDGHETLIELMEGVEDIPEIVMSKGVPWKWESYPEYLDFLEGRRFDMNVAGYLPHACLRVYVMGARALRLEDATPDDVAEMRRLTTEAIKAGALGVATSRTLAHKSVKGIKIPSFRAAEDELKGLVLGMQDAGAGILMVNSDFENPRAEFAMLRRVAEAGNRPLSFVLFQVPANPRRWEIVLEEAEKAKTEGFDVTAQVIGRPISVLLSHELSLNPFIFCPSYKKIAHLPMAERLERMRDPQVRSSITSEYPVQPNDALMREVGTPARMVPVGDKVNYMPNYSECNIALLAEAKGCTASEYLYDYLLENNGKNAVHMTFGNYCDGNSDAIVRMLRSPVTVPGLGDGGAHCKAICDASLPTYLLMRWTGEGEGLFSLPATIKALTADSAALVNFDDRGRVATGLKADLNVIDINKIDLMRPEMVHDLPMGEGRLNQKSLGYVATIVSGAITYRNGEATGALPGRLVRGGAANGVEVRSGKVARVA